MVKFREYYFADMAVSVVTWIRMAAKLWVNFFHTYSDIFCSFLEIFVEKIKHNTFPCYKRCYHNKLVDINHKNILHKKKATGWKLLA